MPWETTSILDQPLAYERVRRFSGMNGYERPTLLPDDICARMVNRLVTDNGACKTRPGFDSLGDAVIATGYTTRVQGMIFHYRLASQRLVAVCNRNWHEWDGANWSAAVGGWQAVNATRDVSIAQLNAMLYVADGSQRIYQYDSTGPTFTALNGPNDPPAAASILVAHAGRVFAAGWTDGVTAPNVIRASNLRAAGTGSWDAVNFETVLTPDYAPVKAMVSMQRNWLAVLHENSIHMMETSPLASTAADWNKQEISRELGCVGPRAALNVAGDCWFWSADGLRSIKGAVGTEGAFEIVNPLSQPLQELVERVNPLAVAKIAMHRYKEFVFIDVPLDSATENDHTLVFNVRLGQWMGYWTGCAATIRTTTYFSGVANQMVSGTSAARVIQWKDTEDQDDDTTYQDDGLDIPTTLRLKSWDFQEPESAKSGDFYVLWFDAAFTVACSVAVAYDTEDQRTDTIEEDEAQNGLPLNLPFDLADERYRRAVRHLDSLGDFHEMYLEITTTAGNCVLVAATCAAFVQSVRDK